jgi:hypothetical protein
MDADRELLEAMIKEHGGRLARSKKHSVYRFPDGRIFVRAQSPSCPRSDKNSLADLRKFLGLNPASRGQPGERREHRRRSRGPSPAAPEPTTRHHIGKSFRQKLREALQKGGLWRAT